MTKHEVQGPRCVAIVGPYQSGKTTLLESILFATGAISRKGSAAAGNLCGDSSTEARAHQMTVETNVATTTYMEERFTFLDCPGSIEFIQESYNALRGVDAAIVVCEPEPDKALALLPVLKSLEDQDIPHLIFVNKIDKFTGDITWLLQSLQEVSAKPLVLRQMPIREGEQISGYVDLANERAYSYQKNQPSERIETPGTVVAGVETARYAMLETLADFDDQLMEQLLEDEIPDIDQVFDDLTADHQHGYIVPVLVGSAEFDHGVRRLLKALRHETPGFGATEERRDIKSLSGSPIAQVLKTYHTPHGGKLSVVRVLKGEIKDGDTLNGERVSGFYSMLGAQTFKLAKAGPGNVAVLGRLEGVKTGDTVSDQHESGTASLPKAPLLPALYGLAISATTRSDEVKLTAAITRLIDEDPSLSFEQNATTNQMVLWGQGEIHLKVATEKLHSKYGLSVMTQDPKIPYKEAIRKPVTQRGRHKRQTGGHGQFGDVIVEIKPLPRGSGFAFDTKISGGAVPRQYFSSVESGVREYLEKGPLGFPIVDIGVTLIDGSYHSVDSSDQAFKTAGRIAMTEGLPQCAPVLLEPILSVDIMVPSDATAKITGLINVRRGHVLGFDTREGWSGWDVVHTHLPQSELKDLIIEVRSLTLGVGTFTWQFDHLSELTGRVADKVIEAHGVA